MTFSSEMIDDIVRNVMRELSLPSASVTAAPSSPAAETVTLSDRVITEDVLAANCTDGTAVILSPGAVLTPSGRDYIRRHQLTVSSQSPTEADAGTGLVIAAAHQPNIAAAAESAGWELLPASGCFDIANQAAQRSAGRHTVCCSPQPSVTACLLNRNTSRRAAVISSDTCLSELIDHMNPDTVCLSPSAWSFGQLLRLLRRLGTRSPAVPAVWEELT